jgi:hypothetical protein
MADTIKNRTEISAALQALAATVDLSELKEAVDDFFARSCVTRKDVASSGSGNGAQSIDFTDIDYFTWDATGADTTLTISGVQQGEIKYLKVTKDAGDTLDFSGAIDASETKKVFDAKGTGAVYKVWNKDGTTHLTNETFIYRIDWSALTASSNIGSVDICFVQQIGKSVTIALNFTFKSSYDPVTDGTLLFTLPSSIVPPEAFVGTALAASSNQIRAINLSTNGEINYLGTLTVSSGQWYASISYEL